MRRHVTLFKFSHLEAFKMSILVSNVSEEECHVCRWKPDEHHPDDWQAFAPWNAHMLCLNCIQYMAYGVDVVVVDPEILEDPTISDPEIDQSVQAVQAVVCSLLGLDIPALMLLDAADDIESDDDSSDGSSSEYEVGSGDVTPEVSICD